ncbi:uncharacterized protein LOC144716317 [Wolffia australiana]
MFQLCYKDGDVALLAFPNPLAPLLAMLEGTTEEVKRYHNFLRAYDSAFGFTSNDANFDRLVVYNHAGVCTYRIQGVYHRFVNQLNWNYDAFHFVLLFPYGNRGWSMQLKERSKVMINQFYAFHLMVRDASRVLHLSGWLFQEYVVDAYAKIEESHLLWVRYNQASLRASLYQGLIDQVAADNAATLAGSMIILPPSFTADPRYMQGMYQDAMSIVRKMGKPDFFITMTCNPNWPEITEALLPSQKKCGLPHAHLLWILDDPYKSKTLEDIAKIEGKCSKKFPKEFISSPQVNNDGHPLYQRRNDGRVIQKGSHLIDNQWIVPYNKYLCKVFNSHINEEICSSILLVKYLYKYVYKGQDCIQARVALKNAPRDSAVADVAQDMQKMYPSVYALQVHTENMQSVVYAKDEPVSDIMGRSAHTPLTE